MSSRGNLHVVEAATEVLKEIEELSSQHRSVDIRRKRWSRVTSRIYTLQRTAGLRTWWAHWRSDVSAEPGIAKSILEFVRAWPLEETTTKDLVELSKLYSDLYPDISLLAAETIVSAPVENSSELWGGIFRHCDEELSRLTIGASTAPERERVAAAWLLATWKFANEAQRRSILSRIPADSDAISALRVQALPLLVAAGASLSEWVAAKPGLAWENALAAEYLRGLQDGEERAIGVALNLLEPAVRLKPQRFIVLPRAVPLIEIVGRSAQHKLSAVAPRIGATLRKNPERLRDHRVEALFLRWCLLAR